MYWVEKYGILVGNVNCWYVLCFMLQIAFDGRHAGGVFVVFSSFLYCRVNNSVSFCFLSWKQQIYSTRLVSTRKYVVLPAVSTPPDKSKQSWYQ